MLQYFLTYLRTILPQEEGQDLAEYALLIGLIALVVVAAVIALGGSLTGIFERIAEAVDGWPTGG
jgi:pilus assembly protein Flp/PilA